MHCCNALANPHGLLTLTAVPQERIRSRFGKRVNYNVQNNPFQVGGSNEHINSICSICLGRCRTLWPERISVGGRPARRRASNAPPCRDRGKRQVSADGRRTDRERHEGGT